MGGLKRSAKRENSAHSAMTLWLDCILCSRRDSNPDQVVRSDLLYPTELLPLYTWLQ